MDATMLRIMGLSKAFLRAEAGEGGETGGAGGAAGAENGSAQPENTENGAETGAEETGDEGLEPGKSLIGDESGSADGNSTENAENGSAGESTALSDEEWMGKVAFVEDMGKDEKGEAVAVNGDFLKPFVPVLREIGLSPEQASKLVTAYAKIERAQGEEAAKARETAEKEAQSVLLKKRDELRAASKKELGEADLAYANRAMDEIKKGDPVFYRMVQTSLLGVHPGFLKLCAMAGKRLADDGLPNPSGVGGGARKSPGEMLFGDAIKNGYATL